MAGDSLFDVTGLRVLVTGAGGDIGRTLVAGLAGRGARVLAVDVSGEDLQAAGFPAAVQTAVADVSDEAAVGRLVAEQVPAALGGLDGLVNNAGIMLRAGVLETNLADWRRVQGVNVEGALLCARAAAPLMLGQGAGAIVNVSSITSVRPMYARAAYATSKAAIAHLTRVMALEWGAQGVRSNALAPGYIRTRMNADLRETPEGLAGMEAAVPQGRLGEPEELVGPVVFLLSAASSHVNGHVLFVDGGMQVA